MELQPVMSTSVLAVGYQTSTRTMRVQFRNGGIYDYFGVDPGLFDQMLQPYPWRRIGRVVKAHAYARVA
jgi:hypothetical protein